jgi:hypothetical protein
VGTAPEAGAEGERFVLRADAPWRWILRLMGVRPGAAQVELTADGRVVATFGPFRVATPVSNVRDFHLTGPYRWWRAIGPRGSGADRGFTFGTSTRDGVCLCFDDWPPARYVRGGRMESLTVTVADPDALAGALRRRGIAGTDERRPAD